jgi:PKD repeat protein
MKKFLLLLILFGAHFAYSQCEPEDCLSSLPPIGGICDTLLMEGRVNEEYLNQISFHITNECIDASTLADVPLGYIKVTQMYNFIFSNLPQGLTAQTNQPSYTPPANGCGGLSGIPTEAGVFETTLTFLIDANVFLFSNCTFSLGSETGQEISSSLLLNILPDPNFSGIEEGQVFCYLADAVELIPTGTLGGEFTGPGVEGNFFNPSAAGAGTHTITYTVSAQEGEAIAPTTDNYSITITVEELEEVQEQVVLCQGDFYSLIDGTIVTEAGFYTAIDFLSSDCPVQYNYEISLEIPEEVFLQESICSGLLYQLPDGSFTDAEGEYFFLLESLNGCDSLVNILLEVLPIPVTEIDVSICPGSSYELPDGSSVQEEGIYSLFLPDAEGCTQEYLIEINFAPTDSVGIETGICEGGTYTLPDGTLVDSAGLYFVMLQNGFGCDSLVVIQLSLDSSQVIQVFDGFCAGSSYLLPDGTSVDSAGLYITIDTSAVDCITEVYTHLVQWPTYQDTFSFSICYKDSLQLPDGSFTNQEGEYFFALSSLNGCDSLLTILVAIDSFQLSFIEAQFCEGDDYLLPDGTLVNQPGTYTTIDSSGLDCPLLITTALSRINSSSITFEKSICEGDVYILPDSTSTQSPGNYFFTYTGSNGCDSLVVINLSVDSLITSEVEVTICSGSGYVLPNGQIVFEAGEYVTIDSLGTCPNSTTTWLSLEEPFETYLEASACQQDGYILPDGNLAIETGLYTFELLSLNGCDSTLLIDLNIVNQVDFEFQVSEFSLLTSNLSTEGNYLWDFGDGSQSEEFSPIHIYAEPGVYTVCLTLIDECGTLTICKEIEIVETSLRSSLAFEGWVMPNPFKEDFQLMLDSRGSSMHLQWEIMNTTGNVLSASEGYIQNSQVKFSGNDLSPGIYYLKVFNKDAFKIFKIIKL